MSTTKLGSNPTEIRIGMIGSVNAGKSTLVGVLTSGELDDGGGSARMHVLRHKHEKERGQTSSIATQHIEFPKENKYYTFVDMAGHERYLKTTVHGLVGHDIDYVLVMVGTSMGVTRMTKEHITTALSLKIPVIVIFTKIDICPPDMLKQTVSKVKKYFTEQSGMTSAAHFFKVNDEKSLKIVKKMFGRESPLCPYFFISSKTGEGLDMLREMLFNLKPRLNWEKHVDKKLIFKVSEPFDVPGVGKVVSGKVIRGKVKKGEKVLFGPVSGTWYKMVAKSLHDNFQREVDHLLTGESGCIALRARSKEFELKDKRSVLKGMVVVDEAIGDPVRTFTAEVVVLTTHSTTIGTSYQPVINVGTVVQSAKIVDIIESEVLRCGDRATVRFEFMYRPELVHAGQFFMFREGETRGLGKIISTN